MAAGDYSADYIVIATAARPRVLPGLEQDGKRLWTYFEAMPQSVIPETLLVIGTGAIGLEFASFYRGLGAKVDVIEALPQILPAEDDEISKFARTRFERQGILPASARVTSTKDAPDGQLITTGRSQGVDPRICHCDEL